MATIIAALAVKAHFTGMGLLGLALYQVTQGELAQAATSLLAGLTAFGLKVGTIITPVAPVAK